MKGLTILQEDEELLSSFESMFITNPEENKKAEEKKPVKKEEKPRLVHPYDFQLRCRLPSWMDNAVRTLALHSARSK